MKKIIKVLLIAIITFTLTYSVNAEVVTQDRETLKDYGVNKKWKITSSNKSNILRTPKVNANEKIYDFENVLTDEEKTQLKQQIDAYMEKTGFELIIVIKNLPYTYDKENEDYAADFYDYNDFGIEKNQYSGTLLLRNTYEQDPYYDFYMFGEAQFYYQGNSRNDYILDDIYNDLHNGYYLQGFSTYIEKLNSYYDMGRASDLKNYYLDENGFLKQRFTIHYIFISLFSLILTIISLVTMTAKNKMIKKATEAADYLDMPSTHFTRVIDNLISSHTTHHFISTDSSSGGGGGFHSSGGSSGGGHSSGGGRHG